MSDQIKGFFERFGTVNSMEIDQQDNSDVFRASVEFKIDETAPSSSSVKFRYQQNEIKASENLYLNTKLADVYFLFAPNGETIGCSDITSADIPTIAGQSLHLHTKMLCLDIAYIAVMSPPPFNILAAVSHYSVITVEML